MKMKVAVGAFMVLVFISAVIFLIYIIYDTGYFASKEPVAEPSVPMIYEELDYSDYTVWSRRASQIDPERTISGYEGFRCPNCKKLHPMLEHGETIVCSCGLKIRLKTYTYIIECWLPVAEESND